MHFLVIGVGSIGERHLRNLLRIDGVRCSFAEVNPAMRERVAAEYEVVASYADYREADLSGFDGAVICTPTNLHVPIATDVVSAGTHVLVEKPLAMSLDGIGALKRLGDEKNVVISVAFTLRSDPLFREVKQLVDSAELGDARMVNFYTGQYWPRMRKDFPPPYAQKRETGGGAIPDHLVHLLNYVEWLFGPADKVSAKQWHLRLDEIATEDTAFVTMTFPRGRVAQFGLCLFQRDTNMRLQVIADAGTIQMSGGADALEIFTDRTGERTSGRARAKERDDVFLDQARHFIACIQGEAKPRCTVEEAEQTLRTVLAALESSDGDGRFVEIQRS